ncbi:MAG: hypothetical protein ACREV1_06110 [Gammaproteobacteria bacterium]
MEQLGRFHTGKDFYSTLSNFLERLKMRAEQQQLAGGVLTDSAAVIREDRDRQC